MDTPPPHFGEDPLSISGVDDVASLAARRLEESCSEAAPPYVVQCTA